MQGLRLGSSGQLPHVHCLNGLQPPIRCGNHHCDGSVREPQDIYEYNYRHLGIKMGDDWDIW